MAVKVSVVVPVYNPGPNIDGLVESLAAQSLPAGQLEVVFVDDGSTDGTAERLQETCARHPNMRVVTIPNSGWPGRPRNVGTDLAEGEYVFYSDNDDYLFPEAMERMYALAARNRSDIVYGKVVRLGRPGEPPPSRNIDVADLLADDVLSSRTVHKMFRRDFLRQHDIRFLEGRVRLEDHHFMAQAMPHAEVVSVLANYPVYQWIHRNDDTNSSSASHGAAFPPQAYWDFYAHSLRTFAEHAGEGPLLDEARLVAAYQAFARFTPEKSRQWGRRHRAAVFAAARGFFELEVPARLDARLPVLRRLRVQAMRAGDQVRFEALQGQRAAYGFDVVVERARWLDGRLDLAVRATLRAEGGLDLMERSGEDLLLRLPDGPAAGSPASDDDRRLLPSDAGSIGLTARHRESGVEWPVSGTMTTVPVETPEGVRLSVRVQATLDPTTAALGSRLDDGIWDLAARMNFLGEPGLLWLPAPSPRGVGVVEVGDHIATAYVTRSGNLALRLSRPNVGVAAGRIDVTSLEWEDDRLALRLAGLPFSGSRISLRGRDDGLAESFPIEDGRAVLALDRLRPGQEADLYVRVESAAGAVDERLTAGTARPVHRPPYAVQVAGLDQGLSIHHLLPGEEPPPLPAVSAVRVRRVPSTSPFVMGLPGPLRRIVHGVQRRMRAPR